MHTGKIKIGNMSPNHNKIMIGSTSNVRLHAGSATSRNNPTEVKKGQSLNRKGSMTGSIKQQYQTISAA
jgi:hypothetical protein